MNGKGSVQRPDDGKYRDNYDKIFGKKDKLDITPPDLNQPEDQRREWLLNRAKVEDECESISVGGLYHRLGFLDNSDKSNYKS